MKAGEYSAEGVAIMEAAVVVLQTPQGSGEPVLLLPPQKPKTMIGVAVSATEV